MNIQCPVCKETTQWEKNEWKPFCSERCKLIDLGEWASEGYIIEGKSLEDNNAKKNERREDD